MQSIPSSHLHASPEVEALLQNHARRISSQAPAWETVGLVSLDQSGNILSDIVLASGPDLGIHLSPCSALKAALGTGAEHVLVWCFCSNSSDPMRVPFVEFLNVLHAGCAEFGLGLRVRLISGEPA